MPGSSAGNYVALPAGYPPSSATSTPGDSIPVVYSRPQAEDPLDLLRGFDTVIVVDDSGSMLARNYAGVTRWQEARDALAGLTALVASKDPDGIDVFFLNSPQSVQNCTDPDVVRRLFDSVVPSGATPTGGRLEELTMEYLDTLEMAKACRISGKPLPLGAREARKRNYLVITDGAPTDELEDVLLYLAQRLDADRFPLSQLGFSFIQVGDDVEAGSFLRQLDDTLAAEGGVRDMVDTTPYEGMALSYDLIVKSLLGGINRRFDRLSNQH